MQIPCAVNHRRATIGVVLVFAAIAFALPMIAAHAASVTNGGFESGDLTGWTVTDSGSGSWFAYSGTSSPLTGQLLPAPPEGSFAATTDQFGPGTHLLSQSVTLEAVAGHSLAFTIYYNNRAGVFSTPDSLASDGSAGPNQQYRVDILKVGAPLDSVASGDVLASVFKTKVGDPAMIPPTPMTFDLSPFAGQTIVLRFAEADNQGYFEANLDDVVILNPVRLDAEPVLVNADAMAVLSGPSATLATASGEPIAGATLTFTAGSSTCSAVTDAGGHASCSIAPDAVLNLGYDVSFGGGGGNKPATAHAGLVRAGGSDLP